ncbi:MAG: AbgT family transporter [Gammaproteobacteria bacterium]|nr:AbgT family transporter [Gammaproteobacteria bacterium]
MEGIGRGWGKRFASVVERAGRRIPDPVIIFMAFYPIAFVASVLLGGHRFETAGAGGESVVHTIRGMHEAEHVRWIFDNALLANWLAFGGGVLGVILVVMLAIGVAEHSGLFAAVIKRLGRQIPVAWMPLLLMLLGITSSVATDAGYLVLIPLAGLLYAGLGRNPLIGMAAAFAGVSAGFSANLIPGTPVDVIIGMNAQVFAESQGIPFENAAGQPLRPATMHYFFIATSTVVLALTGAWVTRRWVEPKLTDQPFEVPDDLDVGSFEMTDRERRGLRAAVVGAVVALALITLLAMGPLAPFEAEDGRRVLPFLNNIILLISLFFVLTGLAFGYTAGTFRRVADVVAAMVAQMNTMGYILVLTFFCYNFLALVTYSGLGSYITYLGAEGLLALGLQRFPVLLLIGFVLTTALINLLIGGLTSKWMLLGPIFVPMLYFVNPAMTPDVVAAAFRVADSATNIITPMMAYAGVILAFMRKYRPELGFGDMLLIMLPYSIAFLLVWTALLVTFFSFAIPLGF